MKIKMGEDIKFKITVKEAFDKYQGKICLEILTVNTKHKEVIINY